MRRKDFAAALHSVANAVHHGGMTLDQARAKMGDIAAAGFADPGADQTARGQAAEVAPEPEPEPEPAEDADASS